MQIPNISLNDGGSIPQLGVGTYKLESDTAQAIVERALELGHRHIDTAKIYKNEAAVGAAIKNSDVRRADLWVTTKLWHDDHDDAVGALEGSLERLGLDYVDLYLIHWPVPKLGTAWQAWRDLIKAREAGLVKSIGVSNFEIPHLERIISDTGVVPAINQVELHPHHQRRKLREFCAQQGIVVESWSPLARGRQELLADPAVTAAATAHGRTPAQVLLRWHLQHGLVVFPKTASADRLIENSEVLDFELDAAQMKALDALEKAAPSGSDPYEFNG